MRGGRGEREYATLIFLTSYCSRVAVMRRCAWRLKYLAITIF